MKALSGSWVVLSVLLAACAGDETDSLGGEEDIEIGQSEHALCGAPYEVDPRLSLMITTPADDDPSAPLAESERTRLQAVWDAVKPKFGFARVMGKIRTTSQAPAPTSNVGLFRRWMDTFNSTGVFADVPHCGDPSVDPKGFGLECGRFEGDLAGPAINPFTNTGIVLEPIAIVNRFDLAPTSGATCGEYRIVFDAASNDVDVTRFLVIFEASLPNPSPEEGIAGCGPVIDRWHGLSDPSLSPAQIANRVDSFFFTGLPGFEPVVSAAHYGLNGGPGQIRTNSFAIPSPWTLREFKTDVTNGLLSFKQVTVKNNPDEQLFKSTNPSSAAFMKSLLTNVRPNARLGAKSIAGIKMTTADRFNTWESTENGTAYTDFADTNVRVTINNQLAAELSAEELAQRGLNAQTLLNRVETQTCMGCHQTSSGAALGDGLVWPNAAGFTHVSAAGQRSEALTQHFLPKRKQVMEAFIASQQCDEAATIEDDGLTLGGSEVGAAN